MKLALLAPLAAIALLAACSHPDQNAGAATGTGTNSSMGGANGTGPGTQQDLANNVGDRVFFQTAQNSLSSDAQATLDRQSSWMGRYPQVGVQVAGNCDERGTEEYNLALGSRRANAARDYLVAHGVSSSRVTTISYGKDQPSAVGSDESSWSQNRSAVTSVQ